MTGIGSAWAAVEALPAGQQVNNDPAAGINPAVPVALGDPTNADVVGGALTAGAPAVPWAIFQQRESTAGGQDQIFVRSFAGGAWTTRGTGTVGGASSSASSFTGSLNFGQGQDAEAPAIDFAGTGRTVPWATWYESAAAFSGVHQVFASRFDNAPDANQNKWIFAGQSRGMGSRLVPVPSLNIHTARGAEDPSVAGGSAADPSKPGPWITWQEAGANVPGVGKDQIFVVKPVGPGSTNCIGVTPAAADPSAAPLGGFCWQQVGVERLGSDPSLNVDRTRSAVEPDIAFTGSNDSVPWVVWYEKNSSAVGLHSNEMVFAAKGVAPSTTTPPTGTVDGGFNWIAVGRTGSGVLDASGATNQGGPCAESQAAEDACSLNVNFNASAEDVRVASGTMAAGTPTVPWVVWDEGTGAVNNNKVFVAHLVGSQFVIANNNKPIGTGDRADISFSRHTPYVTWHHGSHVQTGHFATPNQFVTDNSNIGTNTSSAVRAPISSSCTANPFNGDGSSCQGAPLGTPFFLVTNGSASAAKLFGFAYRPNTPVTGAASGVTKTAATVSGSVNPVGTLVKVGIQFGKSKAYGHRTAQKTLAPANRPISFSGKAGGFKPGETIHYRAFATTDFGTFVGPDRAFKTA
jgi:hypothetical protein